MQRSKIKILEMIPDNAESQYTTSMSPAELKIRTKKFNSVFDKLLPGEKNNKKV